MLTKLDVHHHKSFFMIKSSNGLILNGHQDKEYVPNIRSIGRQGVFMGLKANEHRSSDGKRLPPPMATPKESHG